MVSQRRLSGCSTPFQAAPPPPQPSGLLMVNSSSLFVQGSSSIQLLHFLLLCWKPSHTSLPLCRVKEPWDSHQPELESWKNVSDSPDEGTSVAQLGGTQNSLWKALMRMHQRRWSRERPWCEGSALLFPQLQLLGTSSGTLAKES